MQRQSAADKNACAEFNRDGKFTPELLEQKRLLRDVAPGRQTLGKGERPALLAWGVQNTLAVAYFPQRIAPPVSSALRRFTSVFGMGTGGSASL